MTDSVYVVSGVPDIATSNPIAPTLADIITAAQVHAANAKNAEGVAVSSAATASAAATQAASSAASALADLSTVNDDLSAITTDFQVVLAEVARAVQAADAAAQFTANGVAQFALQLTGTSVTPANLGTGVITLTTQTNKYFPAGTFLLAFSQATPTNWIHGQSSSYSSGVLVINSDLYGGTLGTTVNDWTIELSAPLPSGSGITSFGAVTTGHLAQFTDSTGQTIQDSGATITSFGGTLTGAGNAATGRAALGLGTAATHASTEYLLVTNNLSDVTAATARTNLGLGTSATHITADFLQTANNLSDVVAKTALVNLQLETGTGHGDSSYTILSSDKLVYTNASFTAPRTWTLPAANAVNAGHVLIVADVAGTVTPTNTLTLARAGSDTIAGATSFAIANAYGCNEFVSDGASRWTPTVAGAPLNSPAFTGSPTVPTQALSDNSTTIVNSAWVQGHSYDSLDLLLFGDGSDGTVTISSGVTTLARDMYYANLTLSGTGQLVTSGFKVFVSNTLTIAAAPAKAIVPWAPSSLNGSNASGATFGAGKSGIAASELWIAGAASTDGGASVTSSAVGLQASAASGLSSTGGGAAGNSGAGGNGVSAEAGGASQSSAAWSQIPVYRRLASDFALAGGGESGSGGGSGGSDGGSSGAGGGGGLGGLIVGIYARTINRGGSTAAGAISASGGNGGNGGNAPGSGAGGGGGGPGGGGVVYLVCRTLTGSSATNALSAPGGTGGNGGTGPGSASAGAHGAAGGAIVVFNLSAGTVSTVSGSAGSAASGVTGGAGGACNLTL